MELYYQMKVVDTSYVVYYARAVRYGKNLGIDRAFMYELVPVVADIMERLLSKRKR